VLWTLPDNERTYDIDGGGVGESMPTFWRRSRSGRMLSEVVEWSTFAFVGPDLVTLAYFELGLNAFDAALR
jgi:hypothetical protein